jgi:transcriptional regulator with XRE-family HTH domain
MIVNNFKAIRLKQKMTQQEFAELLGVSRSTIEAIESGRRPISDLVRARLAQKIDLDQESLRFLELYKKIFQIYPN